MQHYFNLVDNLVHLPFCNTSSGTSDVHGRIVMQQI